MPVLQFGGPQGSLAWPLSHLTFQGDHSFPSLHLFVELLILELWSSGTTVLNSHLPAELDLINGGVCWE